jgi:hypothetical protein
MAARCRLAVGDVEGFTAAIDGMWRAARPSMRRSLRPGDVALVALADRLERREPRVSVRMLPPEIRSLIEAPAVPDWVLARPAPHSKEERTSR